MISPNSFDLVDAKLLAISADIRQIALVIILTRAGLSLNINDLKKVGIPPEFLDGQFRTDAQHGIPGAGHAQIRHIAGALGQHLGIGGGYMGVGTPDSTDTAVQQITHSQLLGGSLRMKLHQNDLGLNSFQDLPTQRPESTTTPTRV